MKYRKTSFDYLTGFIGGRLLYALDQEGFRVRCLVRIVHSMGGLSIAETKAFADPDRKCAKNFMKAAYWFNLITPVPSGIVFPLVEGLKN